MATITEQVDDLLGRHPDWTVTLSRDKDNRRWTTHILDRSTGRQITDHISDAQMAQSRCDLRILSLKFLEQNLSLGPLY